jgi:hypothetical protein
MDNGEWEEIFSHSRFTVQTSLQKVVIPVKKGIHAYLTI